MSDENVVSLPSFKRTKEQEDLINKNKEFLKTILNLYFDHDEDVSNSRDIVEHMVENTTVAIVTESLNSFANAFSTTISTITNTPTDPPESLPFENDPCRFTAWSMTAAALHPDHTPEDTANVLRMIKTPKINELMSSVREQFRSFLNDPNNYDNVRPIAEVDLYEGRSILGLVQGSLVKCNYDILDKTWYTEDLKEIYPTHFVKGFDYD